jgi:hypothetical protein
MQVSTISVLFRLKPPFPATLSPSRNFPKPFSLFSLHDHHLLSFQAFALHAKAKKSEEKENSGEPAKKTRKTKASIKKPASSPASTTKPPP